MWKNYLISISRGIGTRNIKNIPPKIVFIVLHDVVGSGSSLGIFIRKMAKSMASALGVRRRFAVCVMVNGMEIKTVPRMRKQIDFLKQQNKLAGRDVITAGPWLS
jgi:hypothetical protein